MILGPVFRAELLRTARRRRYYVLRLLYAALLLVLVWGAYFGTFRGNPTATIAEVARFALQTFLTFTIVQLLTVLVLIPPLFGGAIADEKQRKTLHYLMASRLSSGEIILDKVLGRVPHLAIFLAMGLPILSIIGLFGGISAEYVAIAYVVTISTSAFAVALTVLISTLARRVGQAVLVAYILILAWLVLPTVISVCGLALFPATYAWLGRVNDWLRDTSPLGLWFGSRIGMRAGWGVGRGSPIEQVAWMVGLQLGGGTLCLLLAILRLRPTFRRQEATPARRTWFVARGAARGRSPRRVRRPWPWLVRPSCGDDAVLWKERYFAPTDLFSKLVLLPAIVIVTVPLAMVTELEGRIGQVLLDALRFGTARGAWGGENLVWALRIDFGWYLVFWLLAVAGASASSVTIEREEDTWTSLTTTPLTGARILRAKVLGAIWNQRGFGAVLVGIWSLGLLTGAFHPLGVLASVALTGLLTWFVAALGIHASLRGRSTSRALVSTIVALCVFNGYPVLILLWFVDGLNWESSFSLLGALPRLAAGPLVSNPFVAGLGRLLAEPVTRRESWTTTVAIGLALASLVLGTAAFLTGRCLKRFDRWLDRPALSGPTPAPLPEGAEAVLQA